MAKAGADIVVCHMGLTTGGSIGAETALTLEQCPALVDAWAQTALRVNPEIIVLVHGGPVARPEDAQHVMDNTEYCHGFYGASSMERLPVESGPRNLEAEKQTLEIERESVRPMEKIEGINILHVDGLAGAGGGGRNMTDEVIDSALRYRVQAPLIDSLLGDIGMEGGSLARTGGLIREARDLDSIRRSSREQEKDADGDEKKSKD